IRPILTAQSPEFVGISKLKAKIGLLAILSAALVFAPYGTAHSRHPIHVSVAEIDYDPAEKELEIMIRIFIDDLENALRRYLGQEVEGQALICYILIPGIGSWKECEVTNSILQEMFDDQSNIVHVTQNDVTKSQRLMRRNPTGKFSF